jgi:hypothetical protein
MQELSPAGVIFTGIGVLLAVRIFPGVFRGPLLNLHS